MKYFFIGDQGISMRGLKEYAQSQGHEVDGSDLQTGGHKASNITEDIDLVTRSSAINPGSDGWKEVEAAEKLGIKVIKRSEFLGMITKEKRSIAISGTHGKTTITTMVGLTMINAGFDPTVLVGEKVKEFDYDVMKIGQSDWFVFEACEYDRSFLDFYPEILILTNIEEEHLDTYPGGLPEIIDAYVQYIDNIKDGGIIIACADDLNVKEAINKSKTKAKIVYYGLSADKYNKIDFEIGIPGKHNILNSMSIVALADQLDIDIDIVKTTLKNFSGAKRRFESWGQYNGADLIDDYGHHPTEISAAIESLRERYPDKKKIVIFWPHQYKRVLPLLDKFGQAFKNADEIIIKPIFFVPGRDEILNVSSQDIVNKINDSKSDSVAKVMNTDQEIVDYLKENLDENSVVLTIGIPHIYEVYELLLNRKG